MNAFIDFLEKIDKDVLLLINGAHTPFLDNVMWIISARLTWVPLYLLFVVLIFRDYKKGSWVIYLFVIIAVVLSDQLSVHFAKDVFTRLRPSHAQGIMEHLHYYIDSDGQPYKGGDYGFVSSHAANAASLAVFLMLVFRNKWIFMLLFAWVVLICYSRVYLGVHYPSDILGGIVLGIVTGSFTHKVCTLTQRGSSFREE